jgi:HPt (histidine-containing phosphotransfer) domain-containing protein
MYDSDYQYVEQVFETTLVQLKPDLELVHYYYQNGELENLRKQVHKIKPAFGFVGMRNTETVCQQFENACVSVSSTLELRERFEDLLPVLKESRDALEADWIKLKEYNS